jgi:hypothetical protein
MTTTTVELLGAMSGGISAITALVAVIVAVRSERRSREVMRSHVYLALRNGFRDVYQQLGDLTGGSDEGAALRLARQSYWHQALDEWYVTTRLSSREAGDLWEAFFKPAIAAGYSHPALRSTLEEMRAKRKGFTTYAEDFFTELEAVLAESGDGQ